MTVQLHPHQLDAVEQMHNGCVLWGGVGTGKTIAALAYALKMEPDRQIVIVTTAKVRDSLAWEKEAAKLNIHAHDIQVTSWNKIAGLTEYVDHFFIFDEQRLVGSGAWVKSFYKIAAKNRWILLSATPGDTWSDYAPMFIANGWYKNITEFRREHAVYSRYTKYPKIERWLNQGKLQKYRKTLLVEMPMARHTTRHMHYIECEYDHELLDFVRKKRWNIFTDEPIRNAAELFMVMRKIVSTDPSRVRAIKDLLEKHPKLIVFYNYNYELDILRDICSSLEETWEPTKRTSARLDNSLTRTESRLESKPTSTTPSTELSRIDEKTLETRPNEPAKSIEPRIQIDSLETTRTTEFTWAEWNGHKHEPLPTTSSWIYLVQYQSGSEGWNCTETDSMAFWSLTYSWKQFHQAQGRIDRLNTLYNDLHYYVLMTNSIADKPVMRALNAKHDFQPR